MVSVSWWHRIQESMIKNHHSSWFCQRLFVSFLQISDLRTTTTFVPTYLRRLRSIKTIYPYPLFGAASRPTWSEPPSRLLPSFGPVEFYYCYLISYYWCDFSRLRGNPAQIKMSPTKVQHWGPKCSGIGSAPHVWRRILCFLRTPCRRYVNSTTASGTLLYLLLWLPRKRNTSRTVSWPGDGRLAK